MSDYADVYMASFVKAIDSMTRAAGLKKGEFAAKVWPDVSPQVAANRWKYMRTKFHPTGQPQNVSLADALRMTEVLGADLPYVLLKARMAADEKFEALSETTPKTKPSGRNSLGKNLKK